MNTGDNFWLGRNVLITGISGFIGKWLSRALIDKGANVVGTSRGRKGSNLANDHSGPMICVDPNLDYNFFRRVINEYEVKTIYHFAGEASIPASNGNPVHAGESNTRIVWNLLEACREFRGVGQIVLASSDKVYDTSFSGPFSEESRVGGTTPYAVSKICGDMIANSYFHTYGTPIVIARFCNVYGGDDLKFERLIPGMIKTIFEGAIPVLRSSGQYKRNFLYIKDAVEGYMLLAEKTSLDPKLLGQVFNFSSDRPNTILEVVDMLRKMMGKEHLEPQIANTARNEIAESHMTAEKAKKVLGWYTKYPLEKGLAETISWYLHYLARMNEQCS